jgi:hypothetical protein
VIVATNTDQPIGDFLAMDVGKTLWALIFRHGFWAVDGVDRTITNSQEKRGQVSDALGNQ